MKKILVVSPDQNAGRIIRSCCPRDFRAETTSGKEHALEALKRNRHDFLFIDLPTLRGAGTGDGYGEALEGFHRLSPTLEIIVMAEPDAIRECVMAVKAGASNYVTYPLNRDEVTYVIESTCDSALLQSELDYLRDQFWQADFLEVVQTRSPLMRQVFDKIRSVAPTKSTVLLLGETGTGKGVLANLIHKHSNRKEAQFIRVHCGAIPDTLLESELFGHEKGAFTGAIRRKLGKFEIAKNGTIFLDEIGTVTPSAQIKLLQVLQDGTFQRVGGEETLEADARVIAATNTDLKRLSEEGLFRMDLYYRLNVFPIEIPPLRQRLMDIPHFVDVFLKRLNRFHLKDIRSTHPDVLAGLMNYAWPGNIRELENLVERAYILEKSNVLTPDGFPGELFETEIRFDSFPVDPSLTLAQARRAAVEAIEKKYLEELLTRLRGKIQPTAASAGITTRQLHKLMKKHGMHKEDYK